MLVALLEGGAVNSGEDGLEALLHFIEGGGGLKVVLLILLGGSGGLLLLLLLSGGGGGGGEGQLEHLQNLRHELREGEAGLVGQRANLFAALGELLGECGAIRRGVAAVLGVLKDLKDLLEASGDIVGALGTELLGLVGGGAKSGLLRLIVVGLGVRRDGRAAVDLGGAEHAHLGQNSYDIVNDAANELSLLRVRHLRLRLLGELVDLAAHAGDDSPNFLRGEGGEGVEEGGVL